jgi:hypothetical protein
VGPAIGKRFELGNQTRQHTFNVFTDLRVRKPNRVVSAMPIDTIALRVSFRIVSIAIDFDDQGLLRTEEIYNASSDNVLPTEFETAQLRSADASPELGFKGAAVLTKPFCAV